MCPIDRALSHYSDKFNFIAVPAVWRSDSIEEGLNNDNILSAGLRMQA